MTFLFYFLSRYQQKFIIYINYLFTIYYLHLEPYD